MTAQLELDFDSSATDDGYLKWLRERAERKRKKKPTRKGVEQVDLPTGEDEQGYARWQLEQQAFRASCEAKWGIILGAPVEVSLTFLDQPIKGIIRLAEPDSYEPIFQIRDLTFTTSDVQSVVRRAKHP